MPTYRVQHGFQAPGGDSKDRYINTFYVWAAAAGDETEFASVASYFFSFYDYIEPVSAHPINYWLGRRAAGVGSFIKIYDVAAPLESPPVYQETLITEAFDPSSAVQLPEEVAVCLSYSALHSGSNRPRRRGRVYIGPLNGNAIDADAIGGPVRVDDRLINAMLNAATQLKGDLTTQGYSWRVFSQADSLAFDIIEVSVDDAFDTQRRRGSAPGARFSNTI